MSVTRYKNTDIFLNDDKDYKSVFSTRFGTGKGIVQRETSTLKYPSQNDINSLSLLTEIWTSDSRLPHLAHKHYGNSEYWWVIGFFNKKPLDCHYSVGDVVNIPVPLDYFLTMIGL